MKGILIFGSIICIAIDATPGTDSLEPLEIRVKNLNEQILAEMEGNKASHDLEVYKDIYDYVEQANKVAKPKPRPDAFKELEPKSTTTERNFASPERVDDVGPIRIKKNKSKNIKRSSKKKKNVEIFYRRTIFDANARDKPQKWTHCLDLISPFLNGFLSNVTESKNVAPSNIIVKRLTYLLALNMTDATTEDIRSILYEISHLQLRLFQWDVAAIRIIMNVIIKDYRHDFRGLKYGIKSLFTTWKLNTSNLTRVLTQARIFRPPCLRVTEDAGSTVTPRHDHSKFTKIPKKLQCSRKKDGDEECIMDYNDYKEKE